MRERLFSAFCLAAACAVLAGCGGGGGGGGGEGGEAAISSGDPDGSSHVTFTPSSIQVVQTQGYAEQIDERVTISPEPSGSAFYAVVGVDKPVLETGQVLLIPNADDSATMTLRTDRTLAPGSYEGQLTLHICRDGQCSNEVSLTGNVVPYSIKVVPRVQLEATGVVSSSGLGYPDSYVVRPGATVVVTSNTPVRWSQGGGMTGASLEEISSTPTRWEGKVNGTAGRWVNLLGAAVEKPVNNTASVSFDILE